MDTKQLALRTGTSEVFIRHQMRAAAKAKKIVIQHEPGQGRLNFVEPISFREWLESRGYVEAAKKLGV